MNAVIKKSEADLAAKAETAVILPDSDTDLLKKVEQVQMLTAVTTQKRARRALFCWLRIYVQDGSRETVNLRIPIPLPLVGWLLPDQMPPQKALRLHRQLAASNDPAQTLETYLDQQMAVEFIRVADGDELVIIGLD